MSNITEVTLIVESRREEGLLEYFDKVGVERQDANFSQHLCKLDEEPAGGSKVFTSMIFAAAFNHVSIEAILKYLEAAPYNGNEAVAIIRNEYEEIYKIWTNAPKALVKLSE